METVMVLQATALPAALVTGLFSIHFLLGIHTMVNGLILHRVVPASCVVAGSCPGCSACDPWLLRL